MPPSTTPPPSNTLETSVTNNHHHRHLHFSVDSSYRIVDPFVFDITTIAVNKSVSDNIIEDIEDMNWLD